MLTMSEIVLLHLEKKYYLFKTVEKVKRTTNSVSCLERKSLKRYDNLKKPDIIDELHQQKVKFTSSLSQKQLIDLLLYEMHGISRFPSLLYDYPNHDLEELSLSQYETLPTEPLHDIFNHIKNIYQELPFHVDKADKSLVTKAIERSFHGKEAKNSTDHRKSLLVLCSSFNEKFTNTYLTDTLTTLAEIQEILYSPEIETNVVKVLRLHNITFKHAMLLKTHFANKLKKLTERNFFGVFINCSCLSAISYHLWSYS